MEEKIVYILVMAGPLKGHKFFVKSSCPIMIGRDNEAIIKIDYDNFCSRRHAVIFWKKDACFIEDLNSKNGTYVNDTLIYGQKELKDKDIIGVGETKLFVAIGHNENNLEKLSSNEIKVGDLIGGKYEVHKILKGGMGIVYICYDDKDKTVYALKTFQDKYISSRENQEFFKKEALIWTELERHPYIVRSYVIEKLEGKLFIILEYIPYDEQGRNTLRHYLGQLTYLEILKISIQFCYAMEYAYSKGIDAHRDIKPDNIMITPDKTVKITDFGLAKIFSEIEYSDRKVACEDKNAFCIFENKTGRVCGTLPYMAPEQFDGFADIKSDIYAFGIILYEIATGGVIPFTGKNAEEYEYMHKNANVPDISFPLFPIIKKCLEKSPKKRYDSFACIREALEKLLLKENGEKVFQPESKTLDAGELNNKGCALLSLGNMNEAINYFNKALEIDSLFIHAWSNKGLVFEKMGKIKDAIDCFDKALTIDPGFVGVWLNKGGVLAGLGKLEEAIMCYDNVLKIDSRNFKAWCNKGNALNALGFSLEAIKCFDKAIEINPRDFQSWNNKGIAFHKIGDFNEAFRCHEKSVEINPLYDFAWQCKGILLGAINRDLDAIYCFEKALELNSNDASTWMNKGIALGNLGKYKEAILCLDETLNIKPKDPDVLFLKAVALERIDKLKDALICIEKVLEVESSHAEAKKLKQLIIEKIYHRRRIV